MGNMLETLISIADGLAKQFGQNCEVAIHDLSRDLENTIAYIVNGHVTHRHAGSGSGTSKIVLETMHRDPSAIKDQLGYMTRTPDGRILKSSTIFVRDDSGSIRYIFSINYDITALLAVDNALKDLVTAEAPQSLEQPEQIVNNVNDLLDNLIRQSVALVGKPVALMTKEDKIKAIQFLNDAGAFLITKSGNKVSEYFGISKFTLYSYINEGKDEIKDENT
ncbi:MAG: transcriptional regulator [Clostridiales bacterium]|nr:transcriptional regulator [Clostridiales bacterium]